MKKRIRKKLEKQAWEILLKRAKKGTFNPTLNTIFFPKLPILGEIFNCEKKNNIQYSNESPSSFSLKYKPKYIFDNLARIYPFEYQEKYNSVYDSFEFGLRVREGYKLDELDSKPEIKVKVIVFDDVKDITNEFFEGLLGSSIRKLGLVDFIDKYKFEVRYTLKPIVPPLNDLFENFVHNFGNHG